MNKQEYYRHSPPFSLQRMSEGEIFLRSRSMGKTWHMRQIAFDLYRENSFRRPDNWSLSFSGHWITLRCERDQWWAWCQRRLVWRPMTIEMAWMAVAACAYPFGKPYQKAEYRLKGERLQMSLEDWMKMTDFYDNHPLTRM